MSSTPGADREVTALTAIEVSQVWKRRRAGAGISAMQRRSSSGSDGRNRALGWSALPTMFHLSMNPDYFVGTVVEDETRKLLREQTRRKERARA